MKITSPSFDSCELENLKQCLESKWVTQGPFVERFESLFAERHKIEFAVATTSCTAALHMAILALGIGTGDEVIVPSFTWITSSHCAEYAGAKVVFADIDLHSFNIDPGDFKRKITHRTKAVIAVHLFGHAAQMDEICRIARGRNIQVIEDAACAIGTEYNGRPVGSFGKIGCFSFHPRKVITTGEGGMLSTNDKTLMLKLRSLRNHGAKEPKNKLPIKPYSIGVFDSLGFNLRLSDIQAAVGVAQIKKLKTLLNERKKCAEFYNKTLIDLTNDIALPIPNDKRCGHTYQSYVIRLKNGGLNRRNSIMRSLAGQNIESRIGTMAVHCTEYYRKKYKLHAKELPVSLKAQNTSITLPIFPGMTEQQQAQVVKTLRESL